MDVERLARLPGQQRLQPDLACRELGLINALANESFPDPVGPKRVELVALARLLDRVTGQRRGVRKAPVVERRGCQRV